MLNVKPLWLFYLGRIAGLLAGIALTFFAIRIIPFHKWTLTAIALLPPVAFSRSTLDADQFTIGLAFLFLALALREATARGPMGKGPLFGLALAAFVLAQAKSAYLLLPFVIVALPTERFGTLRKKAAVSALVVLPGLLASIAWMLSLRTGYFEGISYQTWSGIVEPDAQMAAILSNPLDYAGVLLRTVFASPLVPKSMIDFLGVFGPPVTLPLALLPILAIALAALIISEELPPVSPSAAFKSLCLLIAAATIVLILTLLYLQWTRYGGPVVHGFNGRYLYPLAPLFLACIMPKGQRLLLTARGWTIFLAGVGLSAMIWTTWQTYYA
jgi:uncharacterized membrane protein